jgi:arylsulfatase A-like enzyme
LADGWRWFEYFYGFIGGETNKWFPAIYEGTTPVEPDKTPEEGCHFTADMTTKAIKWIRQQKALTPDKPFFVYYAPGAMHAPHHVPKEWADKYKGKFDQGWDRLREETFARQKELGVTPKDCQLTKRHPEIPAWETESSEMNGRASAPMKMASALSLGGIIERTRLQKSNSAV